MKNVTVLASVAFLALTATAFADGDAAKGEKVFKKCQACHDVGANAKNKVGPELNGIVGRKIASIEGFKYSPAMIEFGAGDKVWDEATLTTYLHNPKEAIPKNKMAFVGLKKDDDLSDVIAYLSQFNEDGSAK
ncbi:c-type cytochrome [Polymorphum gilvum]|uniref:Peptide chain release factor 2 n=1 Tax=Polymorphum gilvum (strain LMG 25793 / CGMCC 1.9160 / SL003B-26A1) TaxID=991905 RepID=F2J066_POLGS|nr:cytochrome c family protein [Polymorphum gilvum]ADZ71901.1 Peptide chain release factor 2 [Polymorphum gilvum SL003B-26A1]